MDNVTRYQVAHSPLPWQRGFLSGSEHIGESVAIFDASAVDGNRADAVCVLSPVSSVNARDEANLALILRAVNAHYDLVAALVTIAASAETVADIPFCNERGFLRGLAKAARAALAKVQS